MGTHQRGSEDNLGAMTSDEFRRVFAEHMGFVWRVLLRHGVAARELEDGCQEVFLVVWKRIDAFEGRSSLRTWLYSIAVRVAIAMRRRAFRRRELLADQVPERWTEASQFDESAQSEARALLMAALSGLPQPKREVFVLYELEDMTMAEVAAALDVAENTALSRLYAAREQVQSFVRKHALHARVQSAKRNAGDDPRLQRLDKRTVS
jgi:RNA polymerase sigma-70 factor (ECF subfamily)